MDKYGYDNADLYNLAGISRQLWSSIISGVTSIVKFLH